MRIAISGSTGLIGSALARSLAADGHDVVPIVRSPERDGILLNPESGRVEGSAFEGLDAVVHLAGEPIGAKRWTAEQRQSIHVSRSRGTSLLASALASVSSPPTVLVSGSAVGFYGTRGDEVLDEDAEPGQGFLAEVCHDWEAAADPARNAGIRVAHARTGVVMAPEGALIRKVRLPFKLGLGGRVGTGRQWVPWIALEDAVRALRFLIDEDVAGPVNVTAPEPVTNAELTAALGQVLHRPTILPIPVFALRALFGQMGVSLATDSVRAVPKVLTEAGFRWQVPDLVEALTRALSND